MIRLPELVQWSESVRSILTESLNSETPPHRAQIVILLFELERISPSTVRLETLADPEE